MLEEYLVYLESLKKGQYSKHFIAYSAMAIRILQSNYLFADCKQYFQTYNAEGEPFSDFDLEPDNISQIKKLMNALYYAKLAFQDIENLNLTNTDKSYSQILMDCKQTIHYGFIACQLLTHLDIDLQSIFSEEINLLLPLKVMFLSKVNEYDQQLVETIKAYPLSFNIGCATGIAVNQLQPDGDDLDYTFLTQFSGLLPGYIHQATQTLQNFSSQLIDNERTLNRTKLEEYQNLALSLLNNLEDLKGSDLFVSLKLLQYIKIMNQVITLSATILDQIGELGETSQESIRTQLSELKYNLLPELFGLVDKIEVNTMLAHGTLSLPLMQQIKPLYNFLIYYARKLVNFEAKGEELLTIEDPKFLSLRLERAYKRIDEANKELFQNKHAEQACTKFYEILDRVENKNVCIHELDQEIKEELSAPYKILRPYMAKVDIDVATVLVYSLQGSETWKSWLLTPWRMITKESACDEFNRVLDCRQGLITVIKKEFNSKSFLCVLNEKLITSVQKNSDLAIFRFNTAQNMFAIDESQAFNSPAPETIIFVTDEQGNKYVSNPDNLSSEHALTLHLWYKNKLNHFTIARKAYHDFLALTHGDPLQLKYKERTRARNFYNVFQPYFVSGAPEEERQDVINCDVYLTQMFAVKKFTVSTPRTDLFENFDAHYQTHFTQIDLSWQHQARKYLQIADTQFIQEIELLPLENEPNSENRVHYLIKHQRYSNAIMEFSSSLKLIIKQLNQTMQQNLIAKSFRLPYPEAEDDFEILAQPTQVKAIKQIINNVYHLEQIAINLEKIYDHSTKWDLAQPLFEWNSTVQYIVYAYMELYPIIKSTTILLKDPQLSFIGQELLDKAQNLLGMLQEHTYAYQVTPPEHAPKERIQYYPLWYVLNAFYVSPIHIRALRNNNYISSEELTALHVQAKQANVNIEKIIQNSYSYFRLFLLCPKMHQLYRSLKHKLNEFTSSAHDAVMHNLAEIKSNIFATMLVEADKWESQIGLKPGLISAPLIQILEEYYKGLLEPLGLKSSTHLELIFDNSITELRRLNIEKIKNKVIERKQDKETKYQALVKLYNFVQNNEATLTYSRPQSWSDEFKQQLIDLYTPCLYRLAKLNQKLQIQEKFTNKHPLVDEFLNSVANSYDPELSNIIATVRAGYFYYRGLQKSLEMTERTADEKIDFLRQLDTTKEQENEQFRDEYTQKAFNRELEEVCSRHIGFQYMYKEYSINLKNYLIQFESKIVQKSKNAHDIDRSIQNMLHRYASRFERENYASYYHLESVRSALSQFKHYLNEATGQINSIHEDEETLLAKTRRVKMVDDVADNADLSIDERFRRIRQMVIVDASFKRVLCAQKTVEFLSWTYLQQCFITLLEAINLYTSSRKKHCNEIIESVNNRPQLDILITQFGLFSGKPLRTSRNNNTINLPEPTFRV